MKRYEKWRDLKTNPDDITFKKKNFKTNQFSTLW